MMIEGDCRDILPTLEANSVHACITSPPYFGLRTYGLGTGELGHEARHDCLGWATGEACQEACYVCRLVDVFGHVRRVLRDDGTLWVVLGDAFANKNLLGMPWRVALALQADGWILRSSIIWAKPNPMPESCKDRVTRSHEHVLMFAKSPRYYFDAEAIKESCSPNSHGSPRVNPGKKQAYLGSNQGGTLGKWTIQEKRQGRNRRDVWTIITQAFSARKLGFVDVDHFAAFPEALVEPMIRAATSEAGVCTACGAPWRRLRECIGERLDRPGTGYNALADVVGGTHRHRQFTKVYQTTGWEASCGCHADTAPATVIDPFAGSGTTLAVAKRLGRQGIGIDANPDYIKIATARVARAQGTGV